MGSEYGLGPESGRVGWCFFFFFFERKIYLKTSKNIYS